MNRQPLKLCAAITAALAGPMTAPAQETVELRGLNGANGFVINGIDSRDLVGSSVSGAGDVNGDGLDDLVISAPQADQAATNEGEVYVVFGRTWAFPASLNLSDLNGGNGFVLHGFAAYNEVGISVSGVGDINGDGFDDLVVGARRASPLVYREGESYVVYGNADGFPASLNLSDLDGANGFAVAGVSPGDGSGTSVGGAGDVNGDGLDDLLIGAPDAAGRTGESYVVFGNPAGFPANLLLADLDGTNGFALLGNNTGDFSGISVSGAGDVNGDGIDDVILGAGGASPGFPLAGESYVVFGSDQGFAASLSLTDLAVGGGLVITGVDDYGVSGRSVSRAGDLNGDGLDDVIVGAPHSSSVPGGIGRSHVLFGDAQGFPGSLALSTLDGRNGFTMVGGGEADYAGLSVSTAGDLNGDGIDDVIVGAPGSTINILGRSYVVFGRLDGFPAELALADLDGSDGFVISGLNLDDRFGHAVSGAGDVNGDGIDDVIIGARAADSGDEGLGAAIAGQSYVVFGNAAPRVLNDQALLPEQAEDAIDPAGSRLDFALEDHYLDNDPFGGVAVLHDASTVTQGEWQYSTNATDWSPLPELLSASEALVLDATSWLRFVPAADFAGRPGALTARLWDGRWRQPGEGVDVTGAIGALGGFANSDNPLEVSIDILPVNDPPQFSAVSPPAISEDPGGVALPGWSAFDAGGNETDQYALVYQVANVSNPGLFSVLPTIDSNGNLIYDPARDRSGSSSFDVRVVDSGGTANGGINVSGFQTFNITVNPVNDAPSFDAEDPPTVAINAGAQTLTRWAAFDSGAPDEYAQQPHFQVVHVANPGLFEVAPSIDANGTLRYATAPGADGVTTFTVQVSDDGGTANGGVDVSLPKVFTLAIGAERLFRDSFEAEKSHAR